jgi:hypothetical protein
MTDDERWTIEVLPRLKAASAIIRAVEEGDILLGSPAGALTEAARLLAIASEWAQRVAL